MIKTKKHGFTIVELIMTLVILGIAITMLTPKFVDSMNIWKRETSAKEIVSHLMRQQQRAIAEQKQYGIFFNDNSNAYELGEWVSSAFVSQSTEYMDSAMEFGSWSCYNPDRTVYFDFLGRPNLDSGCTKGRQRIYDNNENVNTYIHFTASGKIYHSDSP